MDINLELPEQIGVEAVDLCSIFCNLLDNALEACEKMKRDSKRYISLSAGIRAGYLLITEKNGMEGEVRKKMAGSLPASRTKSSMDMVLN